MPSSSQRKVGPGRLLSVRRLLRRCKTKGCRSVPTDFGRDRNVLLRARGRGETPGDRRSDETEGARRAGGVRFGNKGSAACLGGLADSAGQPVLCQGGG